MIAIQSYYGTTKPTKWLMESWECSYDSIKEFTNISDIVIYTNNKKNIPKFDNIVSLPNTYKTQFDNGWWQIYKQWLYTQHTEAVHIDTDLIFKKSVEFTGEIICEKIRSNNLFTGIENSLGLPRPLYLYCSGIMGVNSERANELFKTSFDLTLKFIKDARIPAVKDSFRWSLEEGVPYSLNQELKIPVQALDDSYYHHFQGKLQKMNIANHKLVNDKYNEIQLKKNGTKK
jgi:hypothetical protein